MNFYLLSKRLSWPFFVILLILVCGFFIRLVASSQHNLMFGYDEVTDLILVRRIALDHDLIAVGKAIYGNPNLRHGVMSYYLMAPGLAISQDPSFVAMWNGLFSLAGAVVVYFTAMSILKDTRTAIIAAALFASSYLVVGYSNWVSHPTFVLLFVPLFYFSLWKMLEGRGWSFILCSFSLGMAIQSDLIFLYLVPILAIFLAVYKPKYPGVTTMLISVFAFLAVMASFIYSELKFNFASLKTILNFRGSLDASHVPAGERVMSFLKNFFEIFSASISPQELRLGILAGVLVILIIFYHFFKSNRQNRYRMFFLIFYLFSPAITLVIGYHNKPWSLMGIFPAVSLAIAFAISKIRYRPLMIAVIAIILSLNLEMTLTAKEENNFFVDIPETSILSSQLKVIDYTYGSSNGGAFSIDAVNYPLYVNSYWSYHYPWYGFEKYGYKPSWAGSDQIYPYNTLMASSGKEEYLYLIIDNTPDIPLWAKLESKKFWDNKTVVLEEKEIGGYIVQKRKLLL